MELSKVAKIIYTKGTVSEETKTTVYTSRGTKLWEGKAVDLQKVDFINDGLEVYEILRTEILGLPKYIYPYQIYVI